LHPDLPIISTWPIQHHHRNNTGFPRLHECKHLECFIECAKTPRKQRERMRLFHKVQFPREKIIEGNQLGIAFDDFVGSLFRWKPNVKPEAMRAARAPLCGSHDSVTATGDHHEIVRHYFPSEILRHFVLGRIGWSARRSKNGHFSQMLKWREDLGRVAHFFYRTIDQLEIRNAHAIAGYRQRGNDQDRKSTRLNSSHVAISYA